MCTASEPGGQTRSSAIDDLFHNCRQLLGTGHIIPLLQELAVSGEDEDAKVCRFKPRAELCRCRAIKIRDRENVVSRIAGNILFIVAGLKSPRFGIETTSHERAQNCPRRFRDLFLEVDHGNHPVSRIAKTITGHAVADRARLVDVWLSRQDHDRDMTVSGQKSISIDIDKPKGVNLARRKIRQQRARAEKEQTE